MGYELLGHGRVILDVDYRITGGFKGTAPPGQLQLTNALTYCNLRKFWVGLNKKCSIIKRSIIEHIFKA
jgi:hypothetical protein